MLPGPVIRPARRRHHVWRAAAVAMLATVCVAFCGYAWDRTRSPSTTTEIDITRALLASPDEAVREQAMGEAAKLIRDAAALLITAEQNEPIARLRRYATGHLDNIRRIVSERPQPAETTAKERR
jgi:hypothetical protein